MKNLSKIFFNGILALSLILTAFPASSQTSNVPSERIGDLDEMNFIEMINSVPLGKYSEIIQKFQDKEARTKLINGKFGPKSNCTVENFRNKEVLLVTIPANLLFGPNDVELLPKAADYLSPFKRYLKEPDMYRVLLVMHTDNTGSDTYRDEITEDRVDAVAEWFENSGVDTRYLFSYAMGDGMPLVPNDSFVNRDKNRRLEIYLMPGQKMLDQVKKGHDL